MLAVLYQWIKISSSRKTTKAKIPPAIKEEVSVPASASLTLVPEKQIIKSGESFLVTINFKTGDYKVDVVDAVLTFDPKILAVEKISNGSFFADYPVKKWEEGKVILTGTIGTEGKQPGGVKGQGPLGSITFKAKSSGSTDINFDQSSLVVTEGTNVLEETKGASFEIY